VEGFPLGTETPRIIAAIDWVSTAMFTLLYVFIFLAVLLSSFLLFCSKKTRCVLGCGKLEVIGGLITYAVPASFQWKKVILKIASFCMEAPNCAQYETEPAVRKPHPLIPKHARG
jgi:hypothetical protein